MTFPAISKQVCPFFPPPTTHTKHTSSPFTSSIFVLIMLLAIIQRNNNLSENIPRGSNMHLGFWRTCRMSFFAILHVLVYSAGTLRGGRSPWAVARLPAASFSQQKGEPNQLTPGDRHPTPHRPCLPLLCTPSLYIPSSLRFPLFHQAADRPLSTCSRAHSLVSQPPADHNLLTLPRSQLRLSDRAPMRGSCRRPTRRRS